MENSSTKFKKSRVLRRSGSAIRGKGITELDILRKAFEVYLDNCSSFSGNQDEFVVTEPEMSEKFSFEPSPSYQLPGKRFMQL